MSDRSHGYDFDYHDTQFSVQRSSDFSVYKRFFTTFHGICIFDMRDKERTKETPHRRRTFH